MTVRHYTVRYRCALDPGAPIFTMTLRAYNEEHAWLRASGMEEDDWEILSVKRKRVAP